MDNKIKLLGAKGAYEELARDIDGMSIAEKHQWAHVFGSALFRAEGAQGIFVCDSRFSFGCFHQFLGDAIAALGRDSIPELNKKCFGALSKSPLSCQHGIDHGIVASLGYDDAMMRKALDTCAALPGTDPIGGCYGGVFMEYNVRTMLADEAVPRTYNGDPFEPCNTLADPYVMPCIYWQPQWWMQTVLHDKSMVMQFKQMGEYCRLFAHTPDMARACFEGIGNVVAMGSDFDPSEVRNLCKAAGSDATERLRCLVTGANHLGIEVNREAAESVCEDLPDKEKKYCLAYAHNTFNVANVGQFPL